MRAPRVLDDPPHADAVAGARVGHGRRLAVPQVVELPVCVALEVAAYTVSDEHKKAQRAEGPPEGKERRNDPKGEEKRKHAAVLPARKCFRHGRRRAFQLYHVFQNGESLLAIVFVFVVVYCCVEQESERSKPTKAAERQNR